MCFLYKYLVQYCFLSAVTQECLISGRLETAASYLIILQNLEKPIASRQVHFINLVTQLLMDTTHVELLYILEYILKINDNL